LGIFDVGSGRARDFARLLGDMRQLFLRMIVWYMETRDSSLRPEEMWNEFVGELQTPSAAQGTA
jgi:hypothetical protein